MHLAELLRGVEILSIDGPRDLSIGEVREDSRKVAVGDLFVAVRGQTVDGHRYLKAAQERGAVAVVVEEEGIGAETFAGTRIRVRSSAAALALIASNRFGRPCDRLTLVGVTGTNGKTTTTYLAEALARAGGGEPGLIGTVSYRHHGIAKPAPFTTPTPLALHETLAEMETAGCTHVVMECSSHALALERLHGLAFQVAAFTNLTQDHLDFHVTMAAYREAKADLFRRHLVEGGSAVILIDREHGDFMADAVPRGRERMLVSAVNRPDAAIRVTRAVHSIAGIDATVETPAGPLELVTPLIGSFNLENLVVGIGIGIGLGLSPDTIAAALAEVAGAPGRLERVPVPSPLPDFSVFVDYAHTPDALERVMAALRPLTRGRLLVVFGCGGDRDRGKRPKMESAVAEDADLAFVTSDNPRTEEPGSILEMILEGVRKEASPALAPEELAVARRGHVALVDRREAIRAAISAAGSGDVILIAGKGHEDYQILGRTKHPFDDRKEAQEAMRKLASAHETSQS